MTKPGSDIPSSQDAHAEVEIIPLAEEVVRLDKHQVTKAKVRVRTVVEVVDELASASLDEETVEVTRVPVDRIVEQAPDIRTENDVTIIPVLEEVLIVEKRLVLKEELHVRKRIKTEEVEVPVQRRRQQAIVERIPMDDNDADKSA
jgi:hypothetical protein